MAWVAAQLGQSRPANTTAASIYSPSSGEVVSIKGIFVCNTSAASADFRIFHDNNGTTYDETTALFWDITLAVGETFSTDVIVAMFLNSGNLAVRTSVASALTFTVYGAVRS